MSDSLVWHDEGVLYGKWHGMADVMAWHCGFWQGSLAWQLAVGVEWHVHGICVGVMAVSGWQGRDVCVSGWHGNGNGRVRDDEEMKEV